MTNPDTPLGASRAMGPDGPGREPERSSVALVGDHTMRLIRDPGRDVLRVEGGDGRLRVSVAVTDAGVSIELDGAELMLRSSGTISLEAERLALRGREGLSLESGGDLDIRAEGVLASDARTQRIEARTGDVSVRANDDVRLDGERIKMNC